MAERVPADLVDDPRRALHRSVPGARSRLTLHLRRQSAGLAVPFVPFQEAVDGQPDVHRCVACLLDLLTARVPPDPLALGFLRYRVGNDTAARDAFRAAAVAGDPAGMFSWGLMLESEALRDLPGSIAEAARYYWLSALQGFALAQFQVAVMLEQGEVEADFDAAGRLVNAVSFYRAAGRQGLGLAWNNLAFCYLEGCGVEQSLSSARWYFREAIADGYVDHVDAEREIARLDARIAADQVLIAVPDSDSDSETRGIGLGYDFSCSVMFPDTESSESESEDAVVRADPG